MPQGTGDIHSAICAARWKSCPANYTSKAEAFCLSGSALMSWQKKAKGCHLKKRRNEENGRNECLWSWSVIPRLLLSAFLRCTWNVACRFHGKPQHSKAEVPCEIWASIVFSPPPSCLCCCVPMMQNYSNPCIGIGAFFPSFLSFFAPVAEVEIKADLA